MLALGRVDKQGMERFHFFFVCTGNRCRSPFAEALVSSLTYNLPVAVGSAGTIEASPAHVPAEMRLVARAHGLDLSRHNSRPLSAVDLSGADLVLGFERDHVEGAITDAAAPPEATFTLPEMIRLLGRIPVPVETDPILRGRAMVDAANGLRGGRPRLVGWHELADPMGGSSREFEIMASTLASLCEMLVARLFRRKAA